MASPGGKSPYIGSVYLSPRKLELFSEAAALAQSENPALGAFALEGSYLVSIAPDFAAAVVIVVASRFSELRPTSTYSTSYRIASDLINLLIPSTPDGLLIFKLGNPITSSAEQPKVLVRVTEKLLRDIARLYKISVEQEASFVARRLDGTEHGKLVRYMTCADRTAEATTELCISSETIWVRVTTSEYHAPVESEHLPVNFLGPLAFIKAPDKIICHSLSPAIYFPFWPQLRELLAAEEACELAEQITVDLESDKTAGTLSKALQLRWAPAQLETIATFRKGLEQSLQETEEWREHIDTEKLRLCEKILGVKVGDIAISTRQDEFLRLRVEGMNVHTDGKNLLFYVHGRRVRKDGIVGKRSDTIYISVPIDGV